VTVTDIAELAGTAFTAVTAATALVTVRSARSENRIARDALEAQTQPLLTDLPHGLIHEEIDWHEVSGEMTRRLVDRAEISVGTSGPEPLSGVSVPIRNVGNGCARIFDVRFVLPDGSESSGSVANPVLPPNEGTQVQLYRMPGEDGNAIAEEIGMAYADFAVVVRYADASGRPREAVRLEVANGRHPHVSERSWFTLTPGRRPAEGWQRTPVA
jgi:hypothetical protein